MKAVDGSVAVFFVGVVDVGALLLQQHLDAVNRPGSDGTDQNQMGVKVPGPAAPAGSLTC